MGYLADPETALGGRLLRADFVSRGGRTGAPEMVVKVISSTRSREDAGALLRYVGRLRAGDEDEARVKMLWGDGRRAVSAPTIEAARDEAREAFAEFDLEPDSARPRGAILYHLMVSYPRIDNGADLAAMRHAVQAGVGDLFEDRGYPSLWAIHNCRRASPPDAAGGDGHGDVHAHILVRARSRNPENPRLRFDRADLAALRSTFAGHGAMVGLEVEASRIGDREDVVEALSRGERLVGRSNGRRYGGRGDLASRAPDWWARHGNERERDQGPPPDPGTDPGAGQGPGRGTERGARPPGAPESAAEETEDPAVDLVAPLFVEPRRAVRRWRRLRGELKRREGDVSLADWYMRRRPEVFGGLRDGVRDEKGRLVGLLTEERAARKGGASFSRALAQAAAAGVDPVPELTQPSPIPRGPLGGGDGGGGGARRPGALAPDALAADREMVRASLLELARTADGAWGAPPERISPEGDAIRRLASRLKPAGDGGGGVGPIRPDRVAQPGKSVPDGVGPIPERKGGSRPSRGRGGPDRGGRDEL